MTLSEMTDLATSLTDEELGQLDDVLKNESLTRRAAVETGAPPVVSDDEKDLLREGKFVEALSVFMNRTGSSHTLSRGLLRIAQKNL